LAKLAHADHELGGLVRETTLGAARGIVEHHPWRPGCGNRGSVGAVSNWSGGEVRMTPHHADDDRMLMSPPMKMDHDHVVESGSTYQPKFLPSIGVSSWRQVGWSVTPCRAREPDLARRVVEGPFLAHDRVVQTVNETASNRLETGPTIPSIEPGFAREPPGGDVARRYPPWPWRASVTVGDGT